MSPLHPTVRRLLIRPIAPECAAELELVAGWMQATLTEVEGQENAARLHSLEWIRERLRWHLDNPEVCARVLLATIGEGKIIGHIILRREHDPDGSGYGLISTIYILPDYRRLGIADRLLMAGEAWFVGLGLGRSSTWTSATNPKLIRLCEKHGYAVTDQARHEVTGTLMVSLTRRLVF
jgi:GNAT superfamily N-acetyltransferase